MNRTVLPRKDRNDLQFLQRPGACLAWRTDGGTDLPALLVGNSLGADMRSWDPVLPRLGRRFRVIRYDARGHGASTVDEASKGSDYSIESLARDALAVADAAGAARFHYLGLSIGGMLGIWMGRHASERIDRMVLSNTAAQLPVEIWTERIAAVRAAGMQALVDTTMQRWFTPAFHARAGEQIAQVRDVFLHTDVQGYLGCAAAIRDMDLRAALGQIRTPTLVLTGRFDTSTPTALGQQIAAAIPGARWAELPAAHIPQIELPEDYADLVERFLAPAD